MRKSNLDGPQHAAQGEGTAVRLAAAAPRQLASRTSASSAWPGLRYRVGSIFPLQQSRGWAPLARVSFSVEIDPGAE